MNPFIAIAVFLAYALADCLYVAFVRYVSAGRALQAANCSAAIAGIMTLGIMRCIDNQLYLVPLLSGAWLGAFVATQRFDLSTFTRRIFMLRFFALVIACFCSCCLVDSVQAQGSYGSYAYASAGGSAGTYGALGVERRRDRRLSRRASRQSARSARQASRGYSSYGATAYASYGQTAYGSDGPYGAVTAPTPEAAPPAESVAPHNHGAVVVPRSSPCQDGNCSRRFLLGGNRRNSRFQ